MKLHQIIGIAPKFVGPVMGIEVEVEGLNLPGQASLNKTAWKMTHDPSLRGECAEYILSSPQDVDAAKHSLNQLTAAMERKSSQLAFSNRTSVHVHLNVMDMEMQALANLVYLYYIYEDVLLRYCGEDRHHNRFCLSARNADGIIYGIVKRFNPGDIFSFNLEQYKYAALNLAAIGIHGSIEFRGMRGTLDTEVLFPWLDVIQNLYKAAHEYKNPKEIQNRAVDNLKAITKKVFGEHQERFLFNSFEEEVAYNISICAELPQYLTIKEEAPVKKANPKKPIPGGPDEFLNMNVINPRRGQVFEQQRYAQQFIAAAPDGRVPVQNIDPERIKRRMDALMREHQNLQLGINPFDEEENQ